MMINPMYTASKKYILFAVWHYASAIYAVIMCLSVCVYICVSVFDFLRWQPPPSWIFKILNLYSQMQSGGLRCITVQIFVKIGQTVFEILYFLTFQDGSRHHLGFQKFSNFISWGVKRAELHHRAKLHQNPSIHRGVIAIFRFFMGSEGRDASYTKFHQNPSIRCGDIVIFWFLKMAADHHLGFVWGTKGTSWSLSLCKSWLQSMQ